MVAGRQAAHGRPHALHDARALVAEHHRQREDELALDDLEVGVAEPRGTHAHQHVVGAEGARLDALDRQRRTRRAQDSGVEADRFHVRLPSCQPRAERGSLNDETPVPA